MPPRRRHPCYCRQLHLTRLQLQWWVRLAAAVLWVLQLPGLSSAGAAGALQATALSRGPVAPATHSTYAAQVQPLLRTHYRPLMCALSCSCALLCRVHVAVQPSSTYLQAGGSSRSSLMHHAWMMVRGDTVVHCTGSSNPTALSSIHNLDTQSRHDITQCAPAGRRPPRHMRP